MQQYTAFALLALVIASVGPYGTVSYNVARRTGESGIRTVLRAQRSRVLWMVLREGVRTSSLSAHSDRERRRRPSRGILVALHDVIEIHDD